MVERGQFRADLYYRLNVIPLSLPPLARAPRRHSCPCAAFCREICCADRGAGLPRLHPDFLERLQSHTWPGNVRELANFMRRVITLSGTLDIDAQLLRHGISGSVHDRAQGSGQSAHGAGRGRTPIRELEKMHLENTLALTDGNRTHAAEMLGISLRTLRNKIREYGLPPRRYA